MKDSPLLQSDLQSATWKRIRAFIEAEMKRLDEKNRKAWNPEQTAGIRGEIKALDSLLRLDGKTPADNGVIEDGPIPI